MMILSGINEGLLAHRQHITTTKDNPEPECYSLQFFISFKYVEFVKMMTKLESCSVDCRPTLNYSEALRASIQYHELKSSTRLFNSNILVESFPFSLTDFPNTSKFVKKNYVKIYYIPCRVDLTSHYVERQSSVGLSGSQYQVQMLMMKNKFSSPSSNLIKKIMTK